MTDRRVGLVAPDDGFSNMYVARGFAEHGWEVVHFPYRHFVHHYLNQGVGRAQSVVRMNKDLKFRMPGEVDLVVVLKGELVGPDALSHIRGEGVPVALWHFDPRDGKKHWVTERGHAATHLFTIAEGLVPWYEDMGINASWLQEGCDPHSHHPVDVDEKYDVGFIGTISDVGNREEWLTGVQESGFDVHTWGSYPGGGPWTHHGRAEGDEGFRQVVGQTRVNLGRDRNPEIRKSFGARLYRTLACGGFLLTNNTQGLWPDWAGYVARYESDDELPEVIEYYLERPEDRRMIAEKGREHVLEHHTFTHRVKTLVEEMGL